MRRSAQKNKRLAWAAGVHALFNLDTPAGGPFPSNVFTVPDRSQNTNRRVNLPLPDCAVYVSDCEDRNVLNTLDGFNLQPRLSIPFDGPIAVETVTSETVFLISLGSTLRHGDRGGRVIGINQVVWDTFTNTLHVESDELLDQHTRYGLIVTRGVRDEVGDPVEATEAFRRFRDYVRGDYRRALRDALHTARRVGVRERDSALPGRLRLIDELEIRLVHERRGLQRVARALAAQIALSQSAQFRVDDRYQLVQHFRMAVAPVQKHLGDVSWRCRHVLSPSA